MKSRINQVGTNLERKFQLIKGTKTCRAFFYELADYVKYTRNEPTFQPLEKEILKTLNERLHKARSSKDSLWELPDKCETLEELLKVAKENLIPFSLAIDILADLKGSPQEAVAHLFRIPALVRSEETHGLSAWFQKQIDEEKGRGDSVRAQRLEVMLENFQEKAHEMQTRLLEEDAWGEFCEEVSREEKFFDRRKWEDYLSSYHSYLLDYLSRVPKKPRNQTPSETLGIRRLFGLSESPPGIFYRGSGKGRRKWFYPKGKTQSFAILKLVAEKYKRNKRNGAFQKASLTKVMLSFAEIEERLRDPKSCDRPPTWEATYTQKRRLNLLKKNILAIASFTDNELAVEESAGTAFLIFYPPK